MSTLSAPSVHWILSRVSWRHFAAAAALAGFTVFVVLATFTTIVLPIAAPVFLAPLALMIVAVTPQGKASPKKLALALVYMSAVLLPLWPVYLHLKLGPAPIITPPRLVLYVLSTMWLFDMAMSPIRRAQFVYAVKRGAPLTAFVFLFFALGAASLPMAEGRSLAIPEYFRQVMIHFLPFCVMLTYVRRRREFVLFVKLLAGAAIVSGLIACAEFASGKLLASLLSPFIADNAEWLRVAQAQKIRDGVFRAQASYTHPLSLGEFLSMAAPLVLAFSIAARTNALRLMWGGGLFVIFAGAIFTNSRGAMLAIIIAIAATAGVMFYKFLKKTSSMRFRPLAGLITAGLLVCSPVIVVVAHGVVTGAAGEQAANSSQSRVDQITQAWPKILKRPVGGYGVGRSTRVLGYWGRTLTIDNYYLTLAMDMGFPGPIAFFGMLVALGVASLKRSLEGPREEQLMYLGLAAATLAFAVSRSIISQTGNIAILFVLLGAFAGVAGRYKARKSKTDIP